MSHCRTYVLDETLEPGVLKVFGLDIPEIMTCQVHNSRLGFRIRQMYQSVECCRVQLFVIVRVEKDSKGREKEI